MPGIHRGRLPINKLWRQPCTRGSYDVAKLAIDGLGDIRWKQKAEEASSLFVWSAGRVGQLRLDGGAASSASAPPGSVESKMSLSTLLG